MNWFTRLFRRKPKVEPEPEAPVRLRAGPDIIGRQGGQKRNRVHIYRQPFGYPIRLCDWVAQTRDSIEFIGQAQGITGPAIPARLVAALYWVEVRKDGVICKHCRATVEGKREPIVTPPGGNA